MSLKLKLSGWLSRKSASYSSFQKKGALIIFCILFGSLFFYMFAEAFRHPDLENRILVWNHLVMPRPGPVISDAAFRQIEKAKHFLDNIKLHDTLKFKAILLSKPTLLENLRLLENIYQSQKK